MSFVPPAGPHAEAAHALVNTLQARYAAGLHEVTREWGHPASLTPVDWLRDGGRHGGGRRMQAVDTSVFDRASLNVSAVHYDDQPDKRLSSATALSCIVHPRHPLAPSMHMHISWTSLRSGKAYWRIMADLNPSNPRPEHTSAFLHAMEVAAGSTWNEGRQQGDRYFYIPALQRTRGVAHFYLEGFDSGDWDADHALALGFGSAVIDTYCAILTSVAKEGVPPTAEALVAQRAYHSLYFLQVLTLDRGTTSGLLVHGDNDVGILGSLPSTVDRAVLTAWVERQEAPQDALLQALIGALNPGPTPTVDVDTKRRLADVVRAHYAAHPAALELQARGNIVPPTVANHGKV
jgi:coproporphyrinogen III oxidase